MGSFKTTLDSITFPDHNELVRNRVRNMGYAMLDDFTPEERSLRYFANHVLPELSMTRQQQRLLAAMESQRHVLAFHAPETGATTACAMVALHDLVMNRDQVVMVISPTQDIMLKCRKMLRFGYAGAGLALADALFSVRTEYVLATDEKLTWGLFWDPMVDATREYLESVLPGVNTVIIDDAHQYHPDFIRLVYNLVSPECRLVVAGYKVSSALVWLGQQPQVKAIQISQKANPLISTSCLAEQRERYADTPEIYECLHMVPHELEPAECLA